MPSLNPNEAAWVYNGLDCCVTAEIYSQLQEQIDTDEQCVQDTYNFALTKLAPIMEMSLRGTKIDNLKREQSLRSLRRDRNDLDQKFQKIMRELTGDILNWRSPMQLKNLFYKQLGLKPVKKRNAKGQYVATTGREALESFTKYLHARLISNIILVLRDLDKQIGFLKSELDRDGRIRCNYNLAGTNTGRLSSSMNDFGTGTNLQNVNRKLRFPFVADPGMYLLNIDLEQADGRNVAAICYNAFLEATPEELARLAEGDKRLKQFIKDGAWTGPVGEALACAYLDACEGGDLHTTVCRMVWPDELSGEPWPSDESEWKKFCDSIIAHGQDSYRQLSKKGGHGTNYYGTPRTMGKHLHMPTKVIERFQGDYFSAFPAIPLWHNLCIQNILETGTITTPFGRRRMFFGRANDASTHRKAIAYAPQSMTGEQIDRGMYQIWKKYPQVQLLNQVHDSVLLQIPFSEVPDLVPEILETMKVSLELKKGREFYVPLDAAGGWNWGYADEENPEGLKGWKGKEEREPPAQQSRSFKALLEKTARTL